MLPSVAPIADGAETKTTSAPAAPDDAALDELEDSASSEHHDAAARKKLLDLAASGDARAQLAAARVIADDASFAGPAEAAALRAGSAAWVVKAARGGNPEAAAFLSEYYARGHGIPKNPEQALAWDMRAVLGIPDQFKLGALIRIARPLAARDRSLAEYWEKVYRASGKSAKLVPFASATPEARAAIEKSLKIAAEARFPDGSSPPPLVVQPLPVVPEGAPAVAVAKPAPAKPATVATAPKPVTPASRTYRTAAVSSVWESVDSGRYWALTCRGALTVDALPILFGGASGKVLILSDSIVEHGKREQFYAYVSKETKFGGRLWLTLTLEFRGYRLRNTGFNAGQITGNIYDKGGKKVGTWEMRHRPDIRPDLVYGAYAIAADKAKDFDAAAHYYAEANKLKPTPAYRRGRANALLELDRIDEARAIYDDLLATNPFDDDARLERLLLRKNFGKPEEALADADAFIAHHPEARIANQPIHKNLAQVHYYRSQILAKLNRRAESDAAYASGVSLGLDMKQFPMPGKSIVATPQATPQAAPLLATTQKAKTVERVNELLALAKKTTENRNLLSRMADARDADANAALALLMMEDPAPYWPEIHTRFINAEANGLSLPGAVAKAAPHLTRGELGVAIKGNLAATRAYVKEAKALFDTLTLPGESLEALTKRADTGDRDANLALACRYTRGILGAKIDREQAAIRAGVAAARIEKEDTKIADLFLIDNRKVVKERTYAILDPLPLRDGPLKALDLRKKSEDAVKRLADAGDADAQYDLGRRYHLFLSFQFDQPGVDRCLKWFGLAAARGHAESMYVISEILSEDVPGGSPKNIPEALAWLRKAADKNHPKALLELGHHYHNGDFGVQKDEMKARDLYQKSARLGNAAGQYASALSSTQIAYRLRYNAKPGKEAAGAKLAVVFENDALADYERAAAQDHPMAHFRLGEVYHKGLYGKTKDGKTAVDHYRKAVRLGCRHAIWSYVNACFTGDTLLGIAKDPNAAVNELHTLTTERDKEACLKLAQCYGGAEGITPDPVKAYIFYRLHAEYGGVKQEDKIAALAKTLGPEKIKKAEVDIARSKTFARPGPAEY